MRVLPVVGAQRSFFISLLCGKNVRVKCRVKHVLNASAKARSVFSLSRLTLTVAVEGCGRQGQRQDFAQDTAAL